MFFALVSALLLSLSFPRFSLWPCAWVALIPIFYQARQTSNLKGIFLHFYVLGLLFFLISCEWLRHVTYFGWFFVVFAYAFYFGLFGIFVFWFWRRKQYALSLFALPSAWVVLEWIRTEIPVWGFGWNLLAYSQAFQLEFARLAVFFGAYGLSWLIVFFNLALFFLIQFLFHHEKKEGFVALYSFLILGMILGFYFGHQLNLSKSRKAENAVVSIGVIQGNIPQKEKWDPNYKSEIIDTYEHLTRFVPSDEKPDLIVWPEAAFPGFFNLDAERSRVLRLAKDLDVPILLGSPHLETVPGTGEIREIPYNSAYLVPPHPNPLPSGEGRVRGIDRYDKIRLVSFGEYVPWRPIFTPLGLERLAYSLGVSDFEAGKAIKVFSLKEKFEFSVLICFEDTFPSLARRSVEAGADFLVVMTNDAWFGNSAAPYQHVQASVFRAIENKVPVIRAANTGISAFINEQGKVIDRVKDKKGNDIFISGGLIRPVSLKEGKTIYQKWGYQFPVFCLVFVVIGFVLSLHNKKRKVIYEGFFLRKR
jgi:apolipoprotein N-acyltransferase